MPDTYTSLRWRSEDLVREVLRTVFGGKLREEEIERLAAQAVADMVNRMHYAIYH